MNICLKKIALVLTVLALATAGTAIAQDHGNRDWRQGPPSVEDMLARISESLDLTDQQVVDMLVVLQQHAAEREALHDQTMALLGPEICAQKAAAESDILAILTAEQAEQFLLMKAERQNKAAERQRKRGPKHLDCSTNGSDG